MDHDLLMMVYGALIGLCSSFATTIFQSWLERREYERRQKKEKEQEKIRKAIYSPSLDETRAILDELNDINNTHKDDEVKKIIKRIARRTDNPIEAILRLEGSGWIVLMVVFVFLVLICGLYFFIRWLNIPILYIVVPALLFYFSVKWISRNI